MKTGLREQGARGALQLGPERLRVPAKALDLDVAGRKETLLRVTALPIAPDAADVPAAPAPAAAGGG